MVVVFLTTYSNITTKIPHMDRYIRYKNRFVNYLRQVGDFYLVPRFSNSFKLTATMTGRMLHLTLSNHIHTITAYAIDITDCHSIFYTLGYITGESFLILRSWGPAFNNIYVVSQWAFKRQMSNLLAILCRENMLCIRRCLFVLS